MVASSGLEGIDGTGAGRSDGDLWASESPRRYLVIEIVGIDRSTPDEDRRQYRRGPKVYSMQGNCIDSVG